MTDSIQREINFKVTSDTKDILNDMNNLKDAMQEVDKALNDTKKSADFSNYKVGDTVTSGLIDSVSKLGDFKEKLDGTDISLKSLLDTAKEASQTNVSVAGGLEKVVSMLGACGPEAAAATGGVIAVVAGLKLFDSMLKDTIDTMNKAVKIIADLGIDGVEFLVSAFENLCECLKNVNNELNELAQEGKEISDAYYSLFSYLGEDKGSNVSNFAKSLESVYNMDATGVVDQMNDLYVAACRLGDSADSIDKYAESMYMFSLDLSKVANLSTDKVITDLMQAISRGMIGRNSALIRLLSQDEIEEFKSLNTEAERFNYLREKGSAIEGAYQNYLETDAGKVEQLNNQWSSFMGNVGQLALGLYAKIAPFLTNLLNMANSLLEAVMKVFNINVTDSVSKGMAGLAKNSNKATKGIEDTSKAADKAKRKLASFDDVIQISNDSSSNSNSKYGGLDNVNLDSWINLGNEVDKTKSKIGELKDKIIDCFDRKDYFGAGSAISEFIKKELLSLDWDKYKTKAKQFGAGLASFLNGLFSDIDTAKLVGKTLAEGLNTIGSAIHGFLFGDGTDENKGFDFEQFGKALGASWANFWRNIDTETWGDNIYGALKGIVNTVKGWIETGGLFSTLICISDIINQIFSNITEEDINDAADTIIGVIDDIITSIGAFFNNLDIDKIKADIKSFIDRITEDFKSKSDNWADTINKVADTVLGLIEYTLENLDESGLMSAIEGFIGKIDLAGIMNRITTIKLKIWWEGFKIKMSTFFGKLGNFLLDALKNLGLLVLDGFLLLMFNGFTDTASDILASVAMFFTELFDMASDGMADFFGFCADTFDKFINMIKGIPDKIVKIISGAWGAIKSALSNLLGAIKNWWNTNIAKSISFDVPKIFGGGTVSFGIPKLATGGIITKSTIANIGEAGKEAVLPLERNTGWMDTLADAIAKKINSGSDNSTSGGVISVDMSRCEKQFYSRSEMIESAKFIVEALKQYGVNVAINY